MPETEIVVDCTTGEQTEVEMSPEEEAAFLAMRAQAAEEAANPPLSKNEILGLMLADIEPGDEGTTILWIVMQEMLLP